MSTLAELTTNIAADLKDAGNVTWSPEELARAVRWTLLELSRTLPRHASAVLTASEDVREYALSTTGIMHALYVVEVWHPYTAGDPEYPPRAVPWRLLDDDTLYLDVDTVSQGEGIRIFYAHPHTIDGLDDATATTLTSEQEELVCIGAAGYAALQRAQEAIGQVNVTSEAPRLWRQWGEQRLAEFRRRLKALAPSQAPSLDTRITWSTQQ